MQNKFRLILLLSIVTGVAYAAPVESVVTATSILNNKLAASAPTQATPNPNSLNIKSPVMQSTDQDYYQLKATERKIAIKEATDKLNGKPSIVTTGGTTGSNSNTSGISETVATSVVIDPKGITFATLQFMDGSTLNVEPGTKVGKYTVSSIDITGVKLVTCANKKCTKPILIKRAYPIAPAKQGIIQSNQNQSTPLFAQPNNDDSVPPISGKK